MMFRSTVLATLVATAAATSFIPEADIRADSKVGKKIMSKARALEQNGDQDNTWMANYSIKYLGCSSIIQINGEASGDDGSMLYTQNLVKFALCPSDQSCSSCDTSKALYVVNMMEFVDAYSEMKMSAQETKCEYIREYCYCDNANDDEGCENQCYADAGMSECIEYEGDEEFEIQRYLECDEMEGADNDGNNNGGNYNYGSGGDDGVDMYRSYYIGPTCSANDGKTINLAVFLDSGCSSKANTGVYEAFNYGNSLPYESESIVKADECISCMQVDEDEDNNNNNNNNNNNYNYQNQDYELNELCDESYEASAKCEAGLESGNYFYPDTTGCQYINNILPNLEKATRKISRSSANGGGSGGTSTAFAVIFGLATCVLGAYSFFLYRKIHRAKVNLSHSEGSTMA